MAERIEVKGLRELETALKTFTPKLQKNGIRGALTAAARIVNRAAKAKAPVRTGVLKRNVNFVVRKINPHTGRQNAYVGVEAGPVPIPNAEGKVAFQRRGKARLRNMTKREKRGEDPYYYRFQELGFTAVGRRKARTGAAKRRGVSAVGTKVPGKRFLTNGLNNNVSAAIEKFRSNLAAFIARQKP